MERCKYASAAYAEAYELASKPGNKGVTVRVQCEFRRSGVRCPFTVTAKGQDGSADVKMSGECLANTPEVSVNPH